MDHLSTNMSIAAMVFYSILTFFVAPSMANTHLKNKFTDPTTAGFIIGFIISLCLWNKFKNKLTGY
jgi:biotin transporter BioY